MSGLSRPKSTLSFTKDGYKAVVKYNKTVVVAHDKISYALVGNHIYIMISDGCHNTAILCDVDGYGKHPCHLNSNRDHTTLKSDSKLLVRGDLQRIDGVSLEDLNVDECVKHELRLTLAREWISMYESNNGWRPMMDLSESCYNELYSRYKNIIHGDDNE